MVKRPISEELATTFARISDLAEQDRAGEASDQTRERAAYLEHEVDLLCRELRTLQRACSLLARYASRPDALHIWTTTCHELRVTFPTGVARLSQVLASAELELLRLSAYIGGARAKVAERTRQPMTDLAAFIRMRAMASERWQERDDPHSSYASVTDVFVAAERMDVLSDLTAIGAAWDALDEQIALLTNRG